MYSLKDKIRFIRCEQLWIVNFSWYIRPIQRIIGTRGEAWSFILYNCRPIVGDGYGIRYGEGRLSPSPILGLGFFPRIVLIPRDFGAFWKHIRSLVHYHLMTERIRKLSKILKPVLCKSLGWSWRQVRGGLISQPPAWPRPRSGLYFSGRCLRFKKHRLL